MSQILFLSDFHFGVPNHAVSIAREKRICLLLDEYKDKISDVYLVGDIFDFWFEYKYSNPSGFYRFFGKLAELADMNIKIHVFKGNHDMWVRDLFVKEFNATIYNKESILIINGKKIFVAHGDGYGPGDHKYKFLKIFFTSRLCKFLFEWIHPNVGMGIANYFSYKSRFARPLVKEKYHGNENEWLYIFCQDYLKMNSIDYFIFGHRHLPIYTEIDHSNSKYINLGDWLEYDTYAIFDGNEVSLYQYGSNKKNSDFNPNIKD